MVTDELLSDPCPYFCFSATFSDDNWPHFTSHI